MYCDRCGEENREGARFCRACRAELSGVLAPATPGHPPGAPTTADHPVVPLSDAATTPRGASPGPLAQQSVRRALAGKYQVERPLGAGGMGVVYLARDLALDRLVAVKLLPETLAVDAASVQRFLREARLAARLRHPNIVSIHAVGESEGVYFFTMDYIEGETLASHARRKADSGGLTASESLAAFGSIARAVEHAHRHGIVHRDLKPANVMIDRAGHVLVLDFGLATELAKPGITVSGIVVGTPQYMSPEQLEGRPASPGSDVYALGLILYFLLTGEDLVRGHGIPDPAERPALSDPRRVVASAPRIPPALRPLLLSMIERDPGQRPSPGVVLGLLPGLEPADAALAEAPTRVAPSLPPAPSPPPSPRPAVSPYRAKARERMKSLLDKLERKDE